MGAAEEEQKGKQREQKEEEEERQEEKGEEERSVVILLHDHLDRPELPGYLPQPIAPEDDGSCLIHALSAGQLGLKPIVYYCIPATSFLEFPVQASFHNCTRKANVVGAFELLP